MVHFWRLCVVSHIYCIFLYQVRQVGPCTSLPFDWQFFYIKDFGLSHRTVSWEVLCCRFSWEFWGLGCLSWGSPKTASTRSFLLWMCTHRELQSRPPCSWIWAGCACFDQQNTAEAMLSQFWAYFYRRLAVPSSSPLEFSAANSCQGSLWIRTPATPLPSLRPPKQDPFSKQRAQSACRPGIEDHKWLFLRPSFLGWFFMQQQMTRSLAQLTCNHQNPNVVGFVEQN